MVHNNRRSQWIGYCYTSKLGDHPQMQDIKEDEQKIKCKKKRNSNVFHNEYVAVKEHNYWK